MDTWAQTQPAIRLRCFYITQWACLDLGNNYLYAIAVVLSTLLCAGFPRLFILLNLRTYLRGFLHVNNGLLWLKLLLQNITFFFLYPPPVLFHAPLSYTDVFSNVLAALWIQKNPMHHGFLYNRGKEFCSTGKVAKPEMMSFTTYCTYFILSFLFFVISIV